jgi:hypothetical protein
VLISLSFVREAGPLLHFQHHHVLNRPQVPTSESIPPKADWREIRIDTDQRSLTKSESNRPAVRCSNGNELDLDQ